MQRHFKFTGINDIVDQTKVDMPEYVFPPQKYTRVLLSYKS